MSITSTVLIFVLLPAAVMAVVAALALAGGSARRARRYRPGRPYDFTPIWFLASPEQVSPALGGRAQSAIDSGRSQTGTPDSGARVPTGVTGGASDRW